MKKWLIRKLVSFTLILSLGLLNSMLHGVVTAASWHLSGHCLELRLAKNSRLEKSIALLKAIKIFAVHLK
jgi:hypothetical protein